MKITGFNCGVLVQGFGHQHVIPGVTALLDLTEHGIFSTEDLHTHTNKGLTQCQNKYTVLYEGLFLFALYFFFAQLYLLKVLRHSKFT